MSDLDLIGQTNFSQNQSNDSSSQPVKEQVAEAGAELKQRARDAVGAATDTAREKLNEATDAAKSIASDAAEKIQKRAREQQHLGADFVEKFAGNMREAARAFESDVPFAARGINSAAQYVEEAAEKIRNGRAQDLLEGASDFARRQPAAFLGLTVLAGFAVVRFFKASGDQSSSGYSSPSNADDWTRNPSAAQSDFSRQSAASPVGTESRRGTSFSERAENRTEGASFENPLDQNPSPSRRDMR